LNLQTEKDRAARGEHFVGRKIRKLPEKRGLRPQMAEPDIFYHTRPGGEKGRGKGEGNGS